MSFKKFILYLRDGLIQKGHYELNEMAMWMDVLRLEHDDTILYSKLDKDKIIGKVRWLDLSYIVENNKIIFKLSQDGIVLAYVVCTDEHIKIDGRDALTVSLSKRCKELAGHRFGLELYKKILKQFVLISDRQNTPDSANVWRAICDDPIFENGIFDTKLNKVIERNINISFKDGRIWKEFSIEDKFLRGKTSIPLSPEDEHIALYRRVFAYKK